MTPEQKSRIATISGVAVVFGLVATVSYHLSASPTPPPHELKSVAIQQSIIAPGADGIVRVEIITSSIRRADCPAHLMRSIVREATGEVVYHAVGVGGRAPIDGRVSKFDYVANIPAARIPPGRYFYVAVALNKCPGGTVVAASEPAFFEVTAAR